MDLAGAMQAFLQKNGVGGGAAPPGMGGGMPPPGMGGGMPPPGMGGGMPPPGMDGGMGAMLQSQPGPGVTPGRQDEVTMLVAQALDSIQQALAMLDPADERAVTLAQCEQQLGIILANPYQMQNNMPKHEGGSEQDMMRSGNPSISGLPEMQ